MNFDRALVLELARCYMRAAINQALETQTAPATAPSAEVIDTRSSDETVPIPGAPAQLRVLRHADSA